MVKSVAQSHIDIKVVELRFNSLTWLQAGSPEHHPLLAGANTPPGSLLVAFQKAVLFVWFLFVGFVFSLFLFKWYYSK